MHRYFILFIFTILLVQVGQSQDVDIQLSLDGSMVNNNYTDLKSEESFNVDYGAGFSIGVTTALSENWFLKTEIGRFNNRNNVRLNFDEEVIESSNISSFRGSIDTKNTYFGLIPEFKIGEQKGIYVNGGGGVYHSESVINGVKSSEEFESFNVDNVRPRVGIGYFLSFNVGINPTLQRRGIPLGLIFEFGYDYFSQLDYKNFESDITSHSYSLRFGLSYSLEVSSD